MSIKEVLAPLIREFYPYAKERLGFDEDCGVAFSNDPINAQDPLGKTAYYDPAAQKITIFVADRHPKDILRSFSHELVHHAQNARGEFEKSNDMGEGYAQRDPHLREMESEAYLQGNLIFRDWTDKRGSSLNESLYTTLWERNTMSVKEHLYENHRNPQVTDALMERFGYKAKIDVDKTLTQVLNEGCGFDKEEELEEGCDTDHGDDLDETKDPPWAGREAPNMSIEKGTPGNPIELTKKDRKRRMREAIANVVRQHLPALQEDKLTKAQLIKEVKTRLSR